MALFEQLAAKMVADLIRDYKLQAFQAAGFPGNAGEESGGFTKLQEQNPRSGRGGLGFFQDTGPRRVAFEQWLARNADKNWSAGDYAANYSFLVRELDGPEKHVLAPLRAATTVEDATDVVMRVFERPALATAHLEVRVDYARKALAAFHATGQDEDELRAQPRPGATQSGQEVLSPLAKPPPEMEARLARLEQLLVPFLQQLAAGQTRPADPPPAAAPAETAAKPKDSSLGMNIATGVIGVLGSLTASKYGIIGPPVGPGSTAAGFLLPIASAGLAAVGVPAWVLPLVGRLLSAGASRLPGAQK